MPEKPLKHYTYYVVAGQGQAQQLPIHAFALAAPPPEQVEVMYQALCEQTAKQGKIAIGGVPRPTHCAVAVLHELPQPKEAPTGKKPIALFLPRKGA